MFLYDKSITMAVITTDDTLVFFFFFLLIWRAISNYGVQEAKPLRKGGWGVILILNYLFITLICLSKLFKDFEIFILKLCYRVLI